VGSNIAIIGAGALGSYVGAFLARDGQQVTFIDMWPEHVEKMRMDGLHVTGSQGPFTVPVDAMHLTDVQSIQEPFDFAFISVKSYDTEWATHFIKRYVKPEGFFVSLQNCWNDTVIAGIVGPERSVGCIASHIEVALWEPGHVERGGAVGRDSGHYVFRVGEHDGSESARVMKIVSLLNLIDGAYATGNLWGERWAKLSQNSMGNAISASTAMGTLELNNSQASREIGIHLAKESAKVGLAMGLDVVEINATPAAKWAAADQGDVYEELDGIMANRPSRTNWKASMAQDVAKGRRSEIDFMNGLVARKGVEVGVPTPYTDAIIKIMHGVDDGSITPSAAVADMILAEVRR
jgi:2-dehydropantoate 2-reductase